MTHNHEIRYLDDIGRRKLLELSALAIGGLTLNSLLPIYESAAASQVKLPGFAAFAQTVKVIRKGK